jgi:hypothetical protein
MTLTSVATFLAGLSLGPFILAVVNHFLGARKDKLQRDRVHYERYLAEANEAFASYDHYAERMDRNDEPTLEEYELRHAEVGDVFGAEIADEAFAVFHSGDGGIKYWAIVGKMKAHIAKLEKKAGLPPRLLP